MSKWLGKKLRDFRYEFLDVYDELKAPFAFMIVYIALSIMLVRVSMSVGPFVFDYYGFNLTGNKEVTYSDSVNYFLQALIAVALAAISFLKK